jgi:valyl-tRNA synthetase
MLKLAREKSNSKLETKDLRQDVDALDTWFSSWLANVCFGGMDPESEDFKYYYPTNDLVTGPIFCFSG